MTNVVGFLFPVSGIERHTLLSAHTWQIEVSACGWKKWSAQTPKAERQEHTVKKTCFGCWHLKQEQVSGTDAKKLDKFQELAKKTGTGFWNFENGKDIASFTLEIS